MTKEQDTVDAIFAKAVDTPHAELSTLTRLSENGNYFCIWGYETPHDWETVVNTPRYFRLTAGKGSMRRNDRIEVVSDILSPTPTHGTLIVTSVPKIHEAVVAVYFGPVKVDAPFASCWQTLGLDMKNSSVGEIERAFRELSKTLHPDAGGTETAFKALETARTEACAALATGSAA